MIEFEPRLALVVEDDKKTSLVFEQALRASGFDVAVFHDGWVAGEALQARSPGLVVLDLHMPGRSGDDLLQQIRSSPHLERSRVILATADPAMADTLNDLCDLVLIKPISFSQLKELAQRLQVQ